MWSFWWHKDKIPTRIFSYYFLVFIQRYLPIYIDSYALRIHSMIADTASHFRLLRRRREKKQFFSLFWKYKRLRTAILNTQLEKIGHGFSWWLFSEHNIYIHMRGLCLWKETFSVCLLFLWSFSIREIGWSAK